uniref:Lariat debranching enzyme C-terminal domain-containing protein n=1 Tax=Spongospora subterranea TaxID=70186 RepID=A0A0H5QS92_9EUKA|eukprot:CRZ04888.1 hypothetical protein [Spongospora subterranea]
MLIAIAAGVMGEWAAVHRQILKQTRKTGRRPDLLLVPGNSIPARNAGDLAQTHMCDKFQSRHSFYKYYARESTSPCPTIVVGGEHDPSNYLFEMYFGGWLAPRIYYLGASGCVRFGGLRIAGISGVYDQERFDTGYHEPFPLRADDLRTFPFTRQAELFKLRQISGGVDLVLSYDWPTGVTRHLDDDGGSLFERYPHVAGGNGRAVGNPHLDSVLKHLQPQYWIAGRHYVDFTSRIEHDSEQVLKASMFLCAERSARKKVSVRYLELPDIEGSDHVLSYDPEWLTIQRLTTPLLSTNILAPLLTTSDLTPAQFSSVRILFRFLLRLFWRCCFRCRFFCTVVCFF